MKTGIDQSFPDRSHLKAENSESLFLILVSDLDAFSPLAQSHTYKALCCVLLIQTLNILTQCINDVKVQTTS